MPIACGFRSSISCLSTCHCSSPQSSAWRPPTAATTGLAEVRASKTPPCDVPPSAMPLEQLGVTGASRRALIEEHVDRAPAGGEGLGRDDRREHGILVVLAHRNDPEVDACLRMSAGRKVFSRFSSHACCMAACSRSVPNGRSAGGGS